MSKYPVEAGKAERFVPPSLRHLPNPPAFILRIGTPREKAEVRSILRLAGRYQHNQEQMRACIIAGMEALLSPEDFNTWEPQVKDWWDTVDAFGKELKEAIDALPEDATEEQRAALPKLENNIVVNEFVEQVARRWPAFRRLNDDNIRYNEDESHAHCAVTIIDIENLEVDLERDFEKKYLTLNDSMEIREALIFAASTAKIPDIMAPVKELNSECYLSLYLGKRRAKNSESPVPSDPAPASSKNGTGATSGKSKASARSSKTRTPSSAKKSTS